MSTTIGVPPNVAEWLVQAVTRLLATWAIVVGVRVLLGGSERFSGPSYVVALQLPGAPPSWGWWAIITGLVLLGGSLAGFRWIVMLGALGCAAWAGAFAVTLYLAERIQAIAGSTGVPTYATFAVLFVLVLAAYMPSRGTAPRTLTA